MEDNSQSLAIESFSYSWLPESDHKPFSDISYRESHDFNFDVPILPSSSGFSHADELFCNGLIRPSTVDSSTVQSKNSSGFVRSGLLKRWRRSTRRVLRNLVGSLKLFSRKVCCSRKIIKVDDIESRARKVRSWNPSPLSSPGQNTVRSADYWCNFECPIHEAVLHCKRSIEEKRIVGEGGEVLEMHGR